MMFGKKWPIAAILIFVLLFAVGCADNDMTPTDTSAAVDSTAGTTGSALEDSIFDDPTLGQVIDPTVDSDPTEDVQTTEPSGDNTGSNETTTPPSTDPIAPGEMDYKTFMDLSGGEQRAYQESFESLDAFFDWLNAAKEAYEKENPPIVIGGDGVIDMEELFGDGNG